MKFQDIIFFIILLFFIYKCNSRWAAIAGMSCLILAIPLFAKWVFFTAERLTLYGAGFFLLSIIIQILQLHVRRDTMR